ncbi:spore germination protein [Pseudalkalibacillus caeni]|uniref:Spore germination protein n=1 Tax=Exobacillus caeni TaxID=2574798 RepID=A0A5R9EYF0_9BACL|nr:spore germination protein [Pseudalkalibacillus caeni]TLS35226.1 spore germination protein [Pseudalkalibacillus caeni]
MRKLLKRKSKKTTKSRPYFSHPENHEPVSTNMEENKRFVEEQLFHTSDLFHKELTFNGKKILLLYLRTLVDQEKLQNFVIRPINRTKAGELSETINSSEVINTSDLNEAIVGLMKGHCILISENSETIYIVSVIANKYRNIDQPVSEQIIRGSHEGFIESMLVNLYLIRKRVENRNLTIKYFTLGKATQTKVALVYVNNLANPEIIKEVEKRLNAIDTDSIQSPGFIEEYIEDSPYSPFPQLLNTERPDRTGGHLLEGRFAIVMEGSPTVLIAPITLFAFYQSPDDYNSRWYIGSFFRTVRLASFLISMGLPAIYISIVSFHFEVIPIDLIFQIKNSLENVPFPPLFEAIMMVIILELLREASIRLPPSIAQTIGVVGGLVIGTAVVEASLVSNTMIIVIALTAISSFVVPSNEMSTTIRLLSFPLMIGAATLGFFGIIFFLTLILMHLCKLKSFGTPYFAPFAPFNPEGIKDTFIRLPIWKMNKRPLDSRPQHLNRERFSRKWKKNDKETE